ncbi:MAG TPA: spore cortex biosynthesis protein YabQ [Candidatus Avamphibacillus sp.]|nr:spore cortex biosynthesis protein YabQ [Candidatus Avamphibacillus sp.]
MTLDVQFMTMISMILGGIYLGVALETFRRFSPYWKNNRILTYFMEICFWLIQSFVLFYILFRVNGGEIRVYSALACLLGFSAYKALAANFYKRFLERIIIIVTSIYRFFVKVINGLIIQPIKYIIYFFITCLLLILKGLYTTLSFLLKVIVTPVFWILKKVYHLLPEGLQNILCKIAGFYSTIKNIIIKVAKKFKRR